MPFYFSSLIEGLTDIRDSFLRDPPRCYHQIPCTLKNPIPKWLTNRDWSSVCSREACWNLGATRWQTVTRVVLPTASPGIFSAIMIGFGRAVGETMIVLMATGNTPIMEWNPFNGFRTLSANIAVEIPEAPHSGTLYRTLFLAALLLFIFTFAINTAAEFIRQRLRRRYAQL